MIEQLNQIFTPINALIVTVVGIILFILIEILQNSRKQPE